MNEKGEWHICGLKALKLKLRKCFLAFSSGRFNDFF